MHQPILCASIDWCSVANCDASSSSIIPQPSIADIINHYNAFNASGLSAKLNNLKPLQTLTMGFIGLGNTTTLLAIWLLWRKIKKEDSQHRGRFQLVCLEKSPISLADLTCAFDKLLLTLPEIWRYDVLQIRQQLLAQYPPAIPGPHRLIFDDDAFTLDLWLGDIAESLEQLHSKTPFAAWSINQPITQDHVLLFIVQLSHQQTLFFGKDRALIHQLEHSQRQTAPEEKSIAISNIAIIGAGIAGLSVAKALTRRGYAVTLIDKPQTTFKHGSMNPSAMLVPKIVTIDLVAHNLHGLGALSTKRWWQAWGRDVVNPTGALWLITGVQARDGHKCAGYPTDFYKPLDRNATSEMAGTPINCGALYIASGSLLNPQAIRHHVSQLPLVKHIQAEVKRIEAVKGAAVDLPQWVIIDQKEQQIAQFDHVIVAAALDSQQLVTGLPYLRAIRGQVSMMQALSNNVPKVPLCYGGYAAQIEMTNATAYSQDLQQKMLMLGASFVRDDKTTDVRLEEHMHNQKLLTSVAPQVQEALSSYSTWTGRASVRAQAMDYFPLVGSMPHLPNIWVLTGMGSKGFAFAPLCAELLVAQMLDEVWPVTRKLGQQCAASRIVQR